MLVRHVSPGNKLKLWCPMQHVEGRKCDMCFILSAVMKKCYQGILTNCREMSQRGSLVVRYIINRFTING